MRRFHSYGPIDKELHYYAPREALIQKATQYLVGDHPDKGGHYFTVWAPRQTGKTWIMNEVKASLTAEGNYQVIFLNLESLKKNQDQALFISWFTDSLNQDCPNGPLPYAASWPSIIKLFSRDYFTKPVLLILDEFDALDPTLIDQLVSVFRTLYLQRGSGRTSALHGLALVGVRAVVGVESSRGSPFNIQRSLHIPQLTFDEVKGMFEDYQKESAQVVAPVVVQQLFVETQGQPGLVSWFGELLTETYNEHPQQKITLEQWEDILANAISVLPNNMIINLIAKARDPQYKTTLLELFNTADRQIFSFDDEITNYLYLNGIVDIDTQDSPHKKKTFFTRFACPFIQKRLFNVFSMDLFGNSRVFFDPGDDLSDALTSEELMIKNLLDRYRSFIKNNAQTLFKSAPRREDGRLFEAVYHFHLYYFLRIIGERWDIEVLPEFPTGNGKVDLLLLYKEERYAIELKSFRDRLQYAEALSQAATYAHLLKLKEITLCFFIEGGNDVLFQQLEAIYLDPQTGVRVAPFIVAV